MVEVFLNCKEKGESFRKVFLPQCFKSEVESHKGVAFLKRRYALLLIEDSEFVRRIEAVENSEHEKGKEKEEYLKENINHLVFNN